VAEYSGYRKTQQDLRDANLKIASLEKELNRITTQNKKDEKVTTLRNGVTVRSYIDIKHGEIASNARGKKEAYELETRLKINQPAANQTIDELSSLNPELPSMLPGLNDLLENGKVSPLFDKIYQLKLERVVKHMSSPGEMETRHNFFDCETILALTHPRTREKVLLMQGEMDVVADGTDGDRWPYLNNAIASSRYFQHATSYRWKKKTKTPNPLVNRAQADLKKVLARYAVKGLSKSENASLRSRRDELRRQIREMESTSFLIAEIDPFIVLPLSFLKQSKLSHPPGIGDFAVVIYKDKLYPAICGDAGPSWKLGEGSLFLAQTLNTKASPNYRPVSDLKVTYLVFPGTNPKTSEPPNLIAWRNRCKGLLDRIGGLGEGYQLHNWRDLSAEKRSVNELKKLAREFTPMIEKHDKVVAEAKKALAEAEDKVEKLRKQITTLEEEQEHSEDGTEASSAEPKEDIENTKQKWQAAEKQKIVLKNEFKKAVQTTITVRELSEQTKSAIKRGEAIEELPVSTSRELSTDIVLTALTEIKAGLETLKAE